MYSPTRHRVAVFLALVGVAVAGYAAYIDSQLTSGGGYTSVCNLGGTINCDAVIGSRYSRLFGVSVARAGIASFTLGALLAWPGAIGMAVGLADLGMVALASASVGFALALAGVMVFVLRKVCLVCLSIDLVVLVWFATVLPLAHRLAGPWRTAARLVAIVGVLSSLGGGALAALRGPSAATTIDEVKAQDGKFYDLYMKLPVRPAADVAGSARHLKGDATAPVTVVEFSDFECPACGGAFGDLKSFVASRRDVRMVFRHFPLDASCNPAVQHSLHPDACLAAFAAECAGVQGRFWEYHDQLFEHQKVLDRDSLFRYARDVGLDIAAFRTCLDAPETRARVVEDVEVGLKLGIASTPTLFFNGRIIDGALEPPYYDYALIIEKHALAAPRDGG